MGSLAAAAASRPTITGGARRRKKLWTRQNTRPARFFSSRGVPAPSTFLSIRLRLNAPTCTSCRFRMFSCPRRWQRRIPPVS
jgi:hypothetical protein